MVELNKSEAVSLFHAKIDGVPQFVSYFKPVHRALLSFDGQATGRQVYDFIAEHEGLTDEDKAQVNQNGRPTFENRAAWARFYMTKAGWVYSPKRGVWALTDKGKQSEELTDTQAVALFKSVATKFRGHEDEATPDEQVQPDDVQYWFVGTMWWGDDEPDQMSRFLEQGTS